MKIVQLFALLITLVLFSCGNEKKEETSSEEIKYQIDTESVSLNWKAFKTTDKIGVKGKFGTINVKEYGLSDTKNGAIDNVSFSVPISSLFTNNEDRDYKLVNLFFGIMSQPEFISGTFHAGEGNEEAGTGVMDLTMNSRTCDLPYEYKIENDSMFISTTLNLQEWNGQEALDSLNKACYDLHKGNDGVSMTWNEVEISASVALLKK